MKNFYLFILATFTLIFSTHAQVFEDDFEFYVLGDMGIQNPSVWSVWNGDPEAGGGIFVVEGNGGQVGYIGPNSVQDALLLLNNQTSGVYFLEFEMFISASSTAYFNIQGETETNVGTGYQGAGAGGAGVFNSGNLYFNNAGAAPGVFEDDATGETGFYPEDEWFPVFIEIDVDASTYLISIDGMLVHSVPVPFQGDSTLGAIDFFSIDANNNYWIDNIIFWDGVIIGTEDFSPTNFSIYPNPVVDLLHVRSANTVSIIRVYDVLGTLVQVSTPDAISPSIDMSALNSGVYVVEVTIGGASKTMKVIK